MPQEGVQEAVRGPQEALKKFLDRATKTPPENEPRDKTEKKDRDIFIGNGENEGEDNQREGMGEGKGR